MSNSSGAKLDKALATRADNIVHSEPAQQPLPANASEPWEEPLPRPKRQRRRAKTDRGLPPDAELAKLAAEYLRIQRKHWADVAKASLLPEATNAAIAAMVEDFKNRHRTGHVDPEQVRAFLKFCKKLAGDYNRYSCDNSSPTSIIDQMVKGLDKARDEARFVPWAYVYCDYSVSGLNSSRQGYSSYKRVLQDKEHFIETTYVDDFTRASRDEIEWWKLATLSKRLAKRMVGASDGFDLSAVDWDVKISIYGLLSRLFIKGIRQKVMRGMAGAARRRTCLGKPPLGFTRCAQRDTYGAIVRGGDNRPIYRPCIDPATRDCRKLLYELFVEKCWSVYRIVKRFNALKVDGWEGWTDGGIKNLLRSASAVGVFIWNKTRREYDHEEEKWVKVKNPRKDWVVYHDPTLAIVPIGWFKEARKKLAATRRTSALTGRTMSRNERSATTLFSGTLFCASCNRELMLMRSAGKYKVMGCINGPAGKHGCQLTTTKSTRIIETCLLGYFQARLLTEDVVESLVSRANAFLAEEARKPLVSTAPLKASIREKERAIAKLFQRIEHQADKALAQAYEKRIADLQKGVNHLRDQLRAADAQNTPAPKPLDLAAVKALLPDLRAVLNQEIPAAAEAIRALTGQITVRQELIPGKTRGARWIATFSPDLLGWLRRAASDRDYPDSITLKYLCERNWITPEMVEVQLEHTPKYERLAQTIEEMVTRGAGVETVARALGVGWQTARESLEFARTGRRPVTKPSGKRGNRSGPPKFIAHAHEVVRLHDKEQLTFESIAKRLKISKGTVTRACDHVRPEAVRAAAESGRRPQRGRYSRLGPSAYERVRDGLMAGSHPQDIAAEVGCGVSTVYRIRKEMRRDDEHRGIWGALI